MAITKKETHRLMNAEWTSVRTDFTVDPGRDLDLQIREALGSVPYYGHVMRRSFISRILDLVRWIAFCFRGK